ncbi:MAG: hypothetical protein MJB14_14195 [Spirochaetes bacterium]|nr:hypothetical protein [Spirochaetota bacterium]
MKNLFNKKSQQKVLIILIMLILTSLFLVSCQAEGGSNDSLQSAFVKLLRTFDRQLNTLIRTIMKDFSYPLLFSLLGISFIYGIIHSAGPGHGKTLIASFFLKEKHPMSRSLLLGAIVSLVHTGSALIISVLMSFVLTGLRGIFRIKMQSYFILASGICITFIGLLFLILKIIHKDHPHIKENSKNIWLIGFTAGMVPCPVAMMIMLLAFSKNAFWVGLLSIIAISAGMFCLLAFIGVVIIFARKGILSVAGKLINQTEKISIIIEYISIFFIIAIGLMMTLTILIK